VGGVGGGVGARQAAVAFADPLTSQTGRSWVRDEPHLRLLSSPVVAQASRPASNVKSPSVPVIFTAPYTPAEIPVMGIFTLRPGIGNSPLYPVLSKSSVLL
jgi:hypothetical protein